MDKKLLLIPALFLLIIPMVSADLNTNVIHAWLPANATTITDTGAYNNATLTNDGCELSSLATASIPTYNFVDDNTDDASDGDLFIPFVKKNSSIVMWVNVDVNNQNWGAGTYQKGSPLFAIGGTYMSTNLYNNEIQFYYSGPTTWNIGTINIDTDYMITIAWNHTATCVYINDAKVACNASISYNGISNSSAGQTFYIGRNNGGGGANPAYFDGDIGHVIMYDVQINEDNVSAIYGFTSTGDFFPFNLNPPANNVPVMTLVAPQTNNITLDTTPDFTVNCTDADAGDTLSATIYINDVPAGTNTSVTSGVNTIITTNLTLSAGTNYLWNASCTDGTNTSNSTLQRTIKIASTPTLSSVDVTPDTAYTNSTFTCTPTGTFIDTWTYAWYNDSVVLTGETSATLSPDGFDAGDIINCSVYGVNNTLSFTTSTESDTVTISNSNPSISLINPTDNQVTTDNTTLVFNFVVTDDNAEQTLTAELFIDNTPYGENTSLANGSTTGIQINATLANGTHDWYITYGDGTVSLNSSNRTVTIASVVPAINLTTPTPANATNFNVSDVTFNVTASISNVTTCSLYINSTSYYSETFNNGSCFQETANVSTSCGGLSTGSVAYFWSGDFAGGHTVQYALDGDYDTYASPSGNNDPARVFINYTKPVGALPSSKWQVKIGNLTFANFSIPSPCWYASSTILRFEVILELGEPSAGPDAWTLMCRNSTAWHNMTYNISNLPYLYEEAMHWELRNISINISTTQSLSDGAYSYYFFCNDTAIKNESTAVSYFWIDTVPPVSYTTFFNQSLWYSTNNATGSFNFTDETILHFLNISVDSGNIYLNTSMDGTFYQYNLSRNMSNLSIGRHEFITEFKDGHTAEELLEPDAYNPRTSLFNDALEYKIRKPYVTTNIKIYLKEHSLWDNWAVQEQTDRFIEVVTPATPRTTQTFVVEASKPIQIKYDKTGHYLGAWLIIGNHWKDFVLTNEPDVRINIKRISDYKVEVTLTDIRNPEKLTFSSTGDLNIVRKVYDFYNINITDGYPAEAAVYETFNINFTVDFGNLTADMLSGTPTGKVEFNGTNYTATLLSFNSTTAVFSKTFDGTFAADPVNKTFRTYFSYSPYTVATISNPYRTIAFDNWTIDNCTLVSDTTMWIKHYDEENPTTLLNASIDFEIIYWKTDSSLYRNATYRFINNNTYRICIETNETLYANVYMLYKSDNGFFHRYYLYNQRLNGTPYNVSIYNFNRNNSISDLKITARDYTSYQYFEDIIGKLQRKYTDEGVWRTVQMDKSDDYGLLFYNIIEESIDYRLIFSDTSNNILKTTNPLKFVCSSGVCDLTYVLDPYSATAAANDLSSSVTYYNTTGFINLTWTDASGDNIDIEYSVRRDTMTGSVYICNETLTAASGSIGCNVSGYTGEVFIYAEADDSAIIAQYTKLSTNEIGDIIRQAEAAFWTIGIILVCVMIGMFSPAGALIGMMLGLIAVYMLGLFTPITITFIIIAGVLTAIISFKVKQ